MDPTHSGTCSRKPWQAVLLSVAATGLGHIYCGRLSKGLILFFVSFAFAPIIVAAANSAASTFMLALVITSIAAMFFVFVYAAVDAGLLARRINGRYELKEYNRWFIYLLFVVVALGYPSNLSFSIRDHVLQAFKIPSTSMAPSILPGDRIFLNKAVYGLEPIRHGDAVVFVYPNDRRLDYIKRIVALPGDTIEIRDNVVLMNGREWEYREPGMQPNLNFELEPASRVLMEDNGERAYPVIVDEEHPVNMRRLVVPNGYCFVLGDHRNRSKDSRVFGPVPLADVKGRVDYIYWPALSWDRLGRYGG